MELVKILTETDFDHNAFESLVIGKKIKNSKWHIGITIGAISRTLCSGELYGKGDSPVDFETKKTISGKITCPDCIKIVTEIKSIRCNN